MVNTWLDIHTHQTTRRPQVTAVVNTDPLSRTGAVEWVAPYSVGLHPWNVSADQWQADFERVKHLSVAAAAIGECGLDRLRGPDLETQMIVFEAHLQWASALGLPVIIHCVKAFDLLLGIKKRVSVSAPLVVHGFNQNTVILNQLLTQDYYISLGTALFKSQNAQNALKKVPLDRLFLETDAAIDTPIEAVYAQAAHLLGIEASFLASALLGNWAHIKKAALDTQRGPFD